VVGAAVLVGFLVWFFLIRDDAESGDGGNTGQAGGGNRPAAVVQEVAPFGPDRVSVSEVEDAAERLGHEIFWAGDEENLELTVSGDGRAFIRYLTDDVEPGVDVADFLTVATYPISDPIAAIENTASKPGREAFDVTGGGLGVSKDDDPTRVYFALPDSPVQVEVYDPTPGRALELVETGKIEPVS
jgi:hypothetical protein